MYLPEKIMKILSKINTPYVVHYKGDKIYLIETEEKNIKITSTSDGCKLDVKGSTINLRDLDSLEKLLIKLNINIKKNGKKTIKLKENILDLFAGTKNDVAIRYNKGAMISVLVKESNVAINKTEFGYKVRIGTRDITVEDIESIRIVLEKMNIIPIVRKREKKKVNVESSGQEQLMLEI